MIIEHRPELNDDKTVPIHFSTYRAGPKASIFEPEEIYEMLRIIVIESEGTN